MDLSESDREWVKAISAQVAGEIIRQVVENHIQSCPHGKRLISGKNILLGIAIGAVVFGSSSGVGVVIAKFIMDMK